MTTISVSHADNLQRDFSQAHAQLLQARRHQAEKDTPTNRAAVAQWLAFIDALLDMYLDTEHRNMPSNHAVTPWHLPGDSHGT